MNVIFFLQFIPVFGSFLFSLRWGRVILVVLAFCSLRIGTYSFNMDPFPVQCIGAFAGGILGLATRLVLFESARSPFSRSAHERFLFHKFLASKLYLPVYFGLSIFLGTLVMDRFINYFHVMPWRWFEIQDYLYTETFSSVQAFSYSVNILSGFALPLLFFLAEDVTYTKDREEDYSFGILVVVIIQFIVIFIQSYISIDFLNQGTNQASIYSRASGLFRDAGSASFIFPVIYVYSLHFIVSRKIKAPDSKLFAVIIIVILGIIIGKSLGRGYWVLFFFSLFLFGIFHARSIRQQKYSHKLLVAISALTVIPSILFIYMFKEKTGFYGLFLMSQKLGNGLLAALEHTDSYRFFLNMSSWNLFQKFPYLGAGIGSFQVYLTESGYIVSGKPMIVDNPGSMVLGILAELGLLGFFLVIFLSLFYMSTKRIFFSFFVVFIGGLFGYQIVHPDNAFLILLIFGGPLFPPRLENDFKTYFVNVTIFVISFIFFVNAFFRYSLEERVPDFRFHHIHKYQISAYEKNQTAPAEFANMIPKDFQTYHNFKGKIVWKLKQVKTIQLDAFLSNRTRKVYLPLRWTFLDKNFRELEYVTTIAKKWEIGQNTITVPENALYIQIQELNESGNHKWFPDTIFSIPASRFSHLNEYGN